MVDDGEVQFAVDGLAALGFGIGQDGDDALEVSDERVVELARSVTVLRCEDRVPRVNRTGLQPRAEGSWAVSSMPSIVVKISRSCAEQL